MQVFLSQKRIASLTKVNDGMHEWAEESVLLLRVCGGFFNFTGGKVWRWWRWSSSARSALGIERDSVGIDGLE